MYFYLVSVLIAGFFVVVSLADTPCTKDDENWLRDFPREKANAQDDKGRTVLIEAAKEGKLCKVAGLINMKGAIMNIQDKGGYTALMEAAGNGHMGCIKALVMMKGGADIHLKDHQGIGALHWAVIKGHVAIAEYLISRGADFNAPVNNGQTPVMLAGFHNKTDMVQTLINKGADLYARTNGGATALILAAGKGHTEVIEMLLKGGADIVNEQTTTSKYTALMIAARSGYESIVTMLLANGADIYKIDVNRRDALSYACEFDQRVIAKLLCLHGAPLQHYMEQHVLDIGSKANICTSAAFHEEVNVELQKIRQEKQKKEQEQDDNEL